MKYEEIEKISYKLNTELKEDYEKMNSLEHICHHNQIQKPIRLRWWSNNWFGKFTCPKCKKTLTKKYSSYANIYLICTCGYEWAYCNKY